MEPLASRIRPKELAEFVGQEHLVGKGMRAKARGGAPKHDGPLRAAMERKELFSFILWGPPGSGKTTLARLYARAVGAEFYELSAVDAGKDDIRAVIQKGASLLTGKPRVLFIDEIHRFNKAQQDFLLPFVERGDITFVGATTENPSFEVIAPLLSRCRVFVLKEHSKKDLENIIARTKLKIPNDARDWLVRYAAGDARQALTLLETAQKLYGAVTVDALKNAAESRHIRYDARGDEHYQTISAFIKSLRAGEADAALYYLARMVHAGEDPKFIARRMIIFASEDVGLAQPTALVVANAVFEAVRNVGYPEATISLAHGTAYLATAKKDRRAYNAISAALRDVAEHGALPIPLHLRNASSSLMRELGYGEGAEWSAGFRHEKGYFPRELKKRKYLK